MKLEGITAAELMDKKFPEPKAVNFNMLMNCAIEVPDYVEDMKINFEHVEVIFEVGHGYLILLTSGFHFYVTDEQKANMVKSLEAKNKK